MKLPDLNHNCELRLPTDRKIIDTPIAHFWFDDDGILNSIGKDGKRTMKDLKETIRIIEKAVGRKKVCYIVDTANTGYYTIEMREVLTKAVRSLFKAVALLPCTPTGKVMSTILFKRDKNYPAKRFETLSGAKEWLKNYL
jgi:hypothetical protein